MISGRKFFCCRENPPLGCLRCEHVFLVCRCVKATPTAVWLQARSCSLLMSVWLETGDCDVVFSEKDEEGDSTPPASIPHPHPASLSHHSPFFLSHSSLLLLSSFSPPPPFCLSLVYQWIYANRSDKSPGSPGKREGLKLINSMLYNMQMCPLLIRELLILLHSC